MKAEGHGDHPHVAHYDEPDAPDDEDARRDAEALAQADRDSARQMDFARWRALRYVAGFFLACVSIAGGAIALIAAIAALTSGSGPVRLVTGIDASGGATTTTLTRGQQLLFAGVVMALEVVLVWAATLLFSKRLHPGQWVAVGLLAAAATAGLALSADELSLGAGDWPFIVAFPLIMLVSVLETLRGRRLRRRWSEWAHL